jgi:hypothetical protein
MTNLDPTKHVLKAPTNSAAVLEGGRMLASPAKIDANTFSLNGLNLGEKTAANSNQGMRCS